MSVYFQLILLVTIFQPEFKVFIFLVAIIKLKFERILINSKVNILISLKLKVGMKKVVVKLKRCLSVAFLETNQF